MIRFVLLGVFLWILVALHQPYRQTSVPTALTGHEAVSAAGGLVTVTGVTNKVRVREDGSTLLILDCQGVRVSVYADALHRPLLPRVGRSVSATGKRTAAGFLVIEDPAAIKDLGVLDQADNGRIRIPITRVTLRGLTRSGQYAHVGFAVDGGGETSNALVAADQATELVGDHPTELVGYELPGRRFIIESWH